MATPSIPPTYHVLLIGIDDYQDKPLGGCVHDIDAVQRLLVSRMAGTLHIRRLASPRPGVAHDTSVAQQPATLDRIRDALAELASDRVAGEDRVFIYYAGHGTRGAAIGRDGHVYHREALVPVDHGGDGSGLLFDHELNERVRAIAARTASVALVLDCCHAASAVRGNERGEPRTRCIEFPAPRSGAYRSGPPSAPPQRPGDLDACHVVSACLAHERALEDLGDDGVRHGLLTRAFVTALQADDIELSTVRWARIWPAICAGVAGRNADQHPRIDGELGRLVFAGPPKTGDPGIAVRRTEDHYALAAGTLTDITQHARVAVYRAAPAFFPPLGSEPDRALRLGVLRVIAAGPATAVAVPEGAAFELPHGARGRLIATGAASRLRCAVVPREPGVEAMLDASALLEVVPAAEAPEVRLEHSAGRWFLTDSLHGVRRDGPVLFTLHPGELDGARRLLEHYHAYARPLDLARRASDLPGALALRVLVCPPAYRAVPDEAQRAIGLRELSPRTADTYELTEGARVCFQVSNRSAHRLRVTLLNAAASGRVQLLGDDVLEPGASHAFWANGSIGLPFDMVLPGWTTQGIDRLVAVGRTDVQHDLAHLRVDRSFADVLPRTRSGRIADDDGPAPGAPLEHWTAAQAILHTRR